MFKITKWEDVMAEVYYARTCNCDNCNAYKVMYIPKGMTIGEYTKTSVTCPICGCQMFAKKK